jgi:hypothetical protein
MDWFDSREDMAEHIAKKDEHVNPAMTSATALRIEIEHALERRFPAALTPAPRTIREVASTGIPQVDTLLDGGFFSRGHQRGVGTFIFRPYQPCAFVYCP